jgi:hypothetical protein
MFNYSLTDQLAAMTCEVIEIPDLELPPPALQPNFSMIYNSLINKDRLNIKPYTIQDIIRGEHNNDIIINIK